ncbi:hypothetical protein CWI38_1338p0020 [Hamiltosporidium tvaerminnensis]|uniref:Uncharacterized protein n=1 Tax=Hamiltosporidium tvaerminnensis TaxID=1176355 RepID=A0A4V6MVL1_9MICR|nr:hypothetical protein CWI38_1338p0020 [Hamiltosporidium tvaerminnensis]
MLILYISLLFETVLASHTMMSRGIVLCGRRWPMNFNNRNMRFCQITKPLYSGNTKSVGTFQEKKPGDMFCGRIETVESMTEKEHIGGNDPEDSYKKETESFESITENEIGLKNIKRRNIMFWNSVLKLKFNLNISYNLISRKEEINTLKNLEKSIIKLFFPYQAFTMDINKDKDILKNKIFKFDKKIFCKIEDLKNKVDYFITEEKLISKVNDCMNISENNLILKNYIEGDKYFLSFEKLPEVFNKLEFTDPLSWAEFFHDCDDFDLFLSCFYFIKKSFLVDNKFEEKICLTDSDFKDMKKFISDLKSNIFSDFDFKSVSTFKYKKEKKESVDSKYGVSNDEYLVIYILESIRTNKFVYPSEDRKKEKDLSIFEKYSKNLIGLNFQTCLAIKNFVENFLFEDKNIKKENIRKIMDLYDLIFVINCDKYDSLGYSNVGLFFINFYQNIHESISTENRNFFYSFLEICSNFRRFDSLNLNFNLNNKKIDSLFHLSMIIISLNIDETKMTETFLRNLKQDLISCFYLFYGKNGVSSSFDTVNNTEIKIDNQSSFNLQLKNILEKNKIFGKNIYENIKEISMLNEHNNLLNIFTVKNELNVEEILKNLKNIEIFENFSFENEEKVKKIIEKIYGNQMRNKNF